MNSKDFMVLVEKYPLPWVFENYGEPLDYHPPHGPDEEPNYLLSHDEAHDLCEAAPVMAAAIIRFLEWAQRTPASLSEVLMTDDFLDKHLEALRAALPKDLRDS